MPGKILIFLFLAATSCLQPKDTETVVISTESGDIEIELNLRQAPVTCYNFLYFVEKTGEMGGEFYRTVKMDNQPDNRVKIEVIQGGFNKGGPGNPEVKSIPLERTSITGIHHLNGTISMARDDPDSGSTEFFICIGDQPSLDFGGDRNPDGQGFAAFGKVVKGMDVVRKIQSAPSEKQVLQPAVRILKIYRK